MEVIAKSTLETAVAGTALNGICLIKGYSKKQTKTNKDYLDGQIQSGVVMGFKAWSGSSALTKMITEDYTNVPCFISGTIEEYQGTRSITIKDVTAVEGYTPDMFLESKYNKDSYVTAFKNMLNGALSDKGKEVYNLLFNDEILSRFSEEFAAMKYHDNCKSGLLAHTYKMLCLTGWVVQTYPNLFSEYDAEKKGLVASKDKVDLVYLGVALHDLGKITEMNYGVYQPNSFVGHTFFGAERVVQFKDKIVELYGETWYYELISVLLQHHGEFETPYKTVMAFVVHNIDKIESAFTGVAQKLETDVVIDSTGTKVFWDGSSLTF